MATVQETTEVRDRVKDEYIIDTDYHNLVKLEDLIEYIQNPTIKKSVKSHGAPKIALQWKPNYALATTTPGASLGEAYSTDEIIESMEKMGLDEVIANANFLQRLATGRWEPVKSELVRAYNDYMLDQVIDIDEGVYGLLALPQWDPNLAAEELRRLGSEDGFVGAAGWFGMNKPIGSKEYDPIFEELVAHDLPWCLHISGFRDCKPIYDGIKSFHTEFSISAPFRAAINAVNMVNTGVFDKYPDLTMVIQEAGVQWLPLAANRATELYQSGPEDIKLTQRMLDEDQEYLNKQPKDYIIDNFYVTTQPIALPERTDLAESTLDICHASDTFLFSTDWPHNTTDSPEWVIDHPKISEELRSQIYHGNAEKVFRLP